MSWIYWSLICACLTAARNLYIKKYCNTIPAHLLVLGTRGIGTILLLPTLLYHPPTISNPVTFGLVLAVTVTITLIATIANVRIIQRHPLSLTIPYQSLLPLFMIPWALLLLHELPRLEAAFGITITCIGAYVLNTNRSFSPQQTMLRLLKQPGALLMLGISFALACTTVCDRIAIGVSSATTYAFLWTLTSFMVMSTMLCSPTLRKKWYQSLKNKHLYIQAALWAGSFLSQMAGVQMAQHITSGVTYVKTITLLSVFLTVVAGGSLFKEKHSLRSSIAAALMVCGAMMIIAYR